MHEKLNYIEQFFNHDFMQNLLIAPGVCFAWAYLEGVLIS